MQRWAMRVAVAFLCGIGFAVLARAQTVPVASTVPVSSTGRTVFWDYEPLPLVLGAEGGKAQVVITGPAGQTYRLSVPAAGSSAYLTVAPHTLMPGEWKIQSGGAATFVVVSGIPRTQFGMVVYSGKDVVNSPAMVRDEYGWNTLMLFASHTLPVNLAAIDNATLAEAKFTSFKSIADQHQPDSPDKEDWSHPDILASIPYSAKWVALLMRPYGGFIGVHYADEPGLDWVQGDGYRGPLGVPCQLTGYKAQTGRNAPDPLNPMADLKGWMDWMRWRSGLLPGAFNAMSRAVKEVDPKLAAYSQIYEWQALTDGIYPPALCPSVDIVSNHAYPDRDLGMWWPAHEVDAMRSGAWDRPLWQMPTFRNLVPVNGVRGAVYSCLARKVEGIAWPRSWATQWPQAREVCQKILPISGLLLQSQKLRDDVGVFYSQDQMLYDAAQDVKNVKGGRHYVGRLSSAWLMAQAIHCPATRLVEEELLKGVARAHKVILAPGLTYARPEIVAALEKYIREGGMVFLDGASTVKIEGAKTLPFAMGVYFNLPRGSSDRSRWDQFIAPNLQAFEKALAPYVQPRIACDHPMVMTALQGGDQARYAWVVNLAQEESRGRWNLVPVKTTVTLPAGAYVAYDVFAGRRIEERTLNLALDVGDARLYALLPDAIREVSLAVQWRLPKLSVKCAVVSSQGECLDAVIPLTVELFAPGGQSFRKVYRATRHGRFEEELALGRLATPGRWELRVTETLSGMTAKQTFDVAVPAVIEGFSTASVDVVDADRIAKSFDPAKGEFLVLFGDGASAGVARKLVDELQLKGLKAAADEAGNHQSTVPVTRQSYFVKGKVPLDIQRQVVLVGNAASNPLIRRLIADYWLCPRQLNAAYPGLQRSLLYWEQGMFGLHNDIVILYGDDLKGLQRGASALVELMAGAGQARGVRLEVKCGTGNGGRTDPR